MWCILKKSDKTEKFTIKNGYFRNEIINNKITYHIIILVPLYNKNASKLSSLRVPSPAK